MGFRAHAVARQADPLEIVRKSLQTIELNLKQAPNYLYIQRKVQSKKGTKPTVHSYEVLVVEGSPYNRLIAIDDKALSRQQQAEEDLKMRNEAITRRHETDREHRKRTAKAFQDRERMLTLLRRMVNVLEFRLVGEETVDGHDCWVLYTGPKPGYEPQNQEDKVLAGTTGRLWIDKSQYQWVKAQAEVVKPISLYGFLAKVSPGTHFLLEQEPIADNLWLPKHFNIEVNASAFGFLHKDFHNDVTYRDYKALIQSVAELESVEAPLRTNAK